MAREVVQKRVDDIDGGKANQTVQFGLDGAMYEFDLSEKNAAAFRKALVPYLTGGCKSSSVRSPRDPATTPAKAVGAKRARGYDIVQLREWAGANDIAVPLRGRIHRAVLEQ